MIQKRFTLWHRNNSNVIKVIVDQWILEAKSLVPMRLQC
jgi:hypothetical protein